MKFNEVLYYLVIIAFVLVILYIFIFKTEYLTERWFMGGIVAIIAIIFKNLFNLVVKKNGKNRANPK